MKVLDFSILRECKMNKKNFNMKVRVSNRDKKRYF